MTLTKSKLDKIRPILDRWSKELDQQRSIRGAAADLKAELKIKGGGLDKILVLLLKVPEYQPLAAMLLEVGSGFGHAPACSKGKLAALYGADSYEHDEELPTLRHKWFASRGIEYPSVSDPS